MYRFLTPILALIVTVTLFFTFIQPTFEKYKKLDLEIGNYVSALDGIDTLKSRIQTLEDEKAAISLSNMSRLMDFLPDSLDEVSVVLMLDDLATKNNLVLEGIKITSARTKGGSQASTGGTTFAFADDEKDVNKETVDVDGITVRRPQDNIEQTFLTFMVTGEYDNFRTFVTNLEKSLALMDINSLSITEPNEGEFSSYTLGVAMYRFKTDKN